MYIQAIIGILLLCFAQFSIAEEQPDAKQTVDKLNTTIIEAMKHAKSLGYKGRYAKLDPVIKETHDFAAIAQIALGSHWKNLNEEQKKAFIEKLAELSIATYAAQFNSYAGEDFKYESEQGMKANRITLRYQLVAPKEKPVVFEYVLGQVNGQWAIINIVVDGISDLALKKAQYTSIIEREGFDTLLNKLGQKITDYANNNGGVN
jgi:phospholipid transport system substrate-binding protein